MAHEAILELLRRDLGDGEYHAIRELWKQHSLAEDARDVAGLLATLTDDCVYEIVGDDEKWEGHEGAAAFYVELLSAFPDIDFRLTNIVVGPQGVCEEANVSGTWKGPWGGADPTGERVDFSVVIFFPWDPQRRLFKGERVHVVGLPALPSTA